MSDVLSYVLLHGGGMTGRFWDRLVPLLDGAVLAVDLPGRAGKPADLGSLSVEAEVESAVADVIAADLDDDLVLVVHSSGGLITPGVVAGLDGRVRRIVLNAAAVPPEGGSGLDCMQPRHADGVRLAIEISRESGEVLTTSGPPADPEAFRNTYGGEPLDDDSLAYVTDPRRCVVDTLHHYFQPVHWSLAADVPTTYVVNERDRPIPVDLQEEMVARLPRPPEVVRFDGGHLPPVTHAAWFADVVAHAAAT